MLVDENPGIESMASIGSMRNHHFPAAAAIRKLPAPSQPDTLAAQVHDKPRRQQ
jgi:hypothetical protein